MLVSWKIPAAAKVSVCRHSLAWSQACLSGQLPPAYPRGWLCTGALRGTPGLLWVPGTRGCRGNQFWSVGDYVVQLAHFIDGYAEAQKWAEPVLGHSESVTEPGLESKALCLCSVLPAEGGILKSVLEGQGMVKAVINFH